jgi:ankyrin repeat protein
MHRRSRSGRPYFLLAVDCGNLAAVEKFIAVGTSVDMNDDEHPLATSLHISVQRGDIETAQHLIRRGFNLSAANKSGETPLHLAVALRPPQNAMVRLLIDAGANVSASTELSQTVLGAAARHGTAAIVRYLLEQGADATTAAWGNQTPLHGAASQGSAATVRILLVAGLDIEATDTGGDTPLHRAVYSGNVEKVKALLEWGANVHATDNVGDTPLHLAVINDGCPADVESILHHADCLGRRCPKSCDPACRLAGRRDSIVGQLLLAGASITATNNRGISPVDWASDNLNMGITDESDGSSESENE